MFERQLRIFSFLNDTGETIPAFACMALKPDARGDHAATDRNSDMVLSIRKPTAEDALAQDAARIVFNRETPVPNGAYGRCVMSYPALARVDDADLDIGNGVGPVDGSWAMNGNGTAFTAITADPTNSYYENDTKRAWLVRPGSGKPLGFVNFACEEIPAFACMEVTGTLAYGAETYLTVRKPEGAGPFVFNGAYAVASCGYGTIQRLPMVRAKGSIDAKERAVPVAGSWEVSQDDSGVWQSAGPDRQESGVSILNASGLPSLTTTTSGLPNNPGLSACQGSCYWTSSGGVTWTKSTDTCATATTTSTTAPATTTTTTPCPCTSTTTTTSTTVACQCPRPSFCPSLPGDCTYTYCDRQTYDSVDRCTTTTCNCNTTTTTAAFGAYGICGWYIDCNTSNPDSPQFPFSPKYFDTCTGSAFCPALGVVPGFSSSGAIETEMEAQKPCITGTTYQCITTTTTPCAQLPACRWEAIDWDGCGIRWMRRPEPATVLNPSPAAANFFADDPTYCSNCPHPSVRGSDPCSCGDARCPYPNVAPTTCGQATPRSRSRRPCAPHL